MMLANVAAFRGDLVGAEADLRLCLEASPPVRVVAYLSSYLHNVLVHQGRADEAEALHGEIEGWVPIPLSQLEGVVAFARSEYQLAADSLLRARAEYVSRGVFSPARLRWTGKLADALAACGRLDEAWELIHEYRAAAERFGAVAPIADAHVLAGRHSPGPEGREHLEAAHALLEPSPHRLDAARATLELGARLRHDNERTAARELMMPALEYAEHQRVAPLVARLREELAMCGARPRKIVLRGVDALTPAESRIARLAADGLQNKEIAQQLFLTVGTVQTTLVRVYRKLDVSSRRELATAVGR
jgi:DNA-binding CsgD family transcriptional regulator